MERQDSKITKTLSSACYENDLFLGIPMGTSRKVVDRLLNLDIISIELNKYMSPMEMVDSRIEEYRQKFSKRNCGISRMGIPEKARANMLKFFTNYDYTWDHIMKATDLYINERRNSNRPDMISTADNFIYYIGKDGIEFSRLAKACQQIDDSGVSYNEFQGTNV